MEVVCILFWELQQVSKNSMYLREGLTPQDPFMKENMTIPFKIRASKWFYCTFISGKHEHMENVILHSGKTCFSVTTVILFPWILSAFTKKRCGNAHLPTFGISPEQKQEQVPIGAVTPLIRFQFPVLQLKWKFETERLIGQQQHQKWLLAF